MIRIIFFGGVALAAGFMAVKWWLETPASLRRQRATYRKMLNAINEAIEAREQGDGERFLQVARKAMSAGLGFHWGKPPEEIELGDIQDHYGEDAGRTKLWVRLQEDEPFSRSEMARAIMVLLELRRIELGSLEPSPEDSSSNGAEEAEVEVEAEAGRPAPDPTLTGDGSE